MNPLSSMTLLELANLIQSKAEFWKDKDREIRDGVAERLRELHHTTLPPPQMDDSTEKTPR